VSSWIDDLERRAADVLPRAVYDNYRQGSGAGQALAEATPAWDELRLLPRVLRDVTTVSTATTVVGTRVSTPVLLAPTAIDPVVQPGGGAATAQGAAKAGSLCTISCLVAEPYADIRAAGGPWWAQAYVARDRSRTRDLAARAKESGATALVITVDANVWGDRPFAPIVNSNPWYGGRPIADPGSPGSGVAQDLTFADISWLAETSELPVLVKGVLRGDDALAAVRAGARGVIVSNHGGRQLPTAVPTAVALPGVVRALAGTGAETFVDGGVRTGLHVLSALALGARAVLVGRPAMWAAAVDGAEGVAQLIDKMTDELRLAMELSGVLGLDEVTPDLVASSGWATPNAWNLFAKVLGLAERTRTSSIAAGSPVAHRAASAALTAKAWRNARNNPTRR
jgi:4-hydroxymandelate oxidase